jgi:hypothetical protein
VRKHRLLVRQTHLGSVYILSLKCSLANLLALRQSNIDGLGAKHAAVHLGNSLGGLLRRFVADKAETLANLGLITHNLSAGDGTEGGELAEELFVGHRIVKVLHIKVDTLV